MSSQECHMPKNLSKEVQQQRLMSRRQLLKALVAAGGAVTASTLLTCQWSEPLVEVGVLPAHAQVSGTPIASPLYAITTCNAANAAGGGNIGPTDTISSFAIISPAMSGIQLRRTITLNETGHPLNGEIDNVTGPTDASGEYAPPNFDLSTLSPTISSGINRITIRWEFVNSADGTNVCVNLVDII